MKSHSPAACFRLRPQPDCTDVIYRVSIFVLSPRIAVLNYGAIESDGPNGGQGKKSKPQEHMSGLLRSGRLKNQPRIKPAPVIALAVLFIVCRRQAATKFGHLLGGL